jgi:hypothetical protein
MRRHRGECASERLSEAADDDFRAAVQKNLPFKKLFFFSGGTIAVEHLEQLLTMIKGDMTPERVAEILAGGAGQSSETGSSA